MTNYLVSIAVGFRLGGCISVQKTHEIAKQAGCCFWMEDSEFADTTFILGPKIQPRRCKIVGGPLAAVGELTFEEVAALGPELERIRHILHFLGHVGDGDKAVITLAVLIF